MESDWNFFHRRIIEDNLFILIRQNLQGAITVQPRIRERRYLLGYNESWITKALFSFPSDISIS